MENRINIAELLKDCPKGMELNCVLYENVTLEYVVQSSSLPICIRIQNKGTMFLSRYGQLHDQNCCKCIIFPKGKTTWEGFQRPFIDGDIVALDSVGGAQVFIFKEYIDAEKEYVHCYVMLDDDGGIDLEGGDYYVVRFATEEEEQRLFDAIKANGYKWNTETKTLEKLPKFKVRDRIKGKYTNNIHTISGITSRGYELTNGQTFTFNAEDCYELVPNKFDISTLKPFDGRVLVRDYSYEVWRVSFWGCLINSERGFIYDTTRGCYKQCIPFEGNEHLLGKTDDCDNFYKIWE